MICCCFAVTKMVGRSRPVKRSFLLAFVMSCSRLVLVCPVQIIPAGSRLNRTTVLVSVINKRVCAAASNRIASKRVWSRTACKCQAKGMRNQCRSGGGGGGVMSTGVLVWWCLGPGQRQMTDNSGCRLRGHNTEAGNGAGLPREACLRRISPTVWRTGRGGQCISLKRART
jgi:hypothetical protein